MRHRIWKTINKIATNVFSPIRAMHRFIFLHSFHSSYLSFFFALTLQNAARSIARRSEEFVLVLRTAKESNEAILHCIVSICDGTSRQRSIALQTWFTKYFIGTIKCQLVFCSFSFLLLQLFSTEFIQHDFCVQFYRRASSSRRWLINALGPLIALRDNASLLLYAQMSWRCCLFFVLLFSLCMLRLLLLVCAHLARTWENYGVKSVLQSCLNTFGLDLLQWNYRLTHFIVTMHINLHYIDENLRSSLLRKRKKKTNSEHFYRREQHTHSHTKMCIQPMTTNGNCVTNTIEMIECTFAYTEDSLAALFLDRINVASRESIIQCRLLGYSY